MLRQLTYVTTRTLMYIQYQSSIIGRRGLCFQNLTAFTQLDPSHIPWYKVSLGQQITKKLMWALLAFASY